MRVYNSEKSLVDAVMANFDLKGLQWKGIAQNYSTDLNDIVEPGIYGTNGTVMTNTPSSHYTWSVLVVLPIATSMISTAVTQMLYTLVGIHHRKRTGNPLTWSDWVSPIVTSEIKAATISGTTTQTGALLIPTQYQSKPILEVYCNSGTALVYRRDTAYLMFANTSFQPLSNQQVSAKIWYLDI